MSRNALRVNIRILKDIGRWSDGQKLMRISNREITFII